MPNEDYLDWTLYVNDVALPFSEAKFCCGYKWRWYGLDIEELNAGWEEGKLYKMRIVEDMRADREAQVLGPPLYPEAADLTSSRASD